MTFSIVGSSSLAMSQSQSQGVQRAKQHTDAKQQQV